MRCASLLLLIVFSFECYSQIEEHFVQYSDTVETVLNLEEVEVEVYSAGADMGCPVKISTIKAEKLDRSAASSRLLAATSIPGVNMITAGGGTIRPSIRGLAGLRITTLYRGARIESQAWSEDHGIYIPEQGVNRVEVIKGPSALAYGTDCIGGVLNFIAENPLNSNGSEKGVNYRWFSNTNGYQASFITKSRSDKKYHSYSGGYNNHGNYLRPNGEEVANSYYEQFFGQGEFGYILDWGLIDGAYSSAYNNAGIIGQEGARQQSGDHLITTNATLLKWGWKFKPVVTYQLNHRIEYHNEDGVDEAELDISLRSMKYEFKGVKTLDNEINIITGVQGATTSASNGEDLEHTFLPDADQTDLGAYIISSYGPKRLKVKAAARGDMRKVQWGELERGFHYGATSLGLNYRIGLKGEVSAIGSLSNRAPSIAELSADGLRHGAYRYEVGDADLDAETAMNLELNLRRTGKSASVDLNVYRNEVSNFIHYRAEEGVLIDGYQKYNYVATNALIQGFEFGLRCNVKKLKANASLAYVDAQDMILNQALPFIPPITFRSSLLYEADEVWKAKDFFSSVSYMQTPAFNVLSISLGFAINESVNVQFSGNNLLNEEYVPVMSLLRELDIPQQGRDLSARITYNF